ncbi:hypothetical protein MIR68_005491 [Amoeboaphelidium protococcarum]|nr:hypothetical protein MIR68_005491 [Amoeboaphelidium protococcarum]
MFTINKVVDGLRISSVIINGGSLYIGTLDGVLLVFTQTDAGQKWKLQSTQKSLAGQNQAILLIEIIKSLDIIILGTDKRIFVVGLSSMVVKNVIQCEPGGVFCVQQSPFVKEELMTSYLATRIVIYTNKKHLTAYVWLDDEYSHSEQIALPQTIGVVLGIECFSRDSLLIQCKSGYFVKSLADSSLPLKNLFQSKDVSLLNPVQNCKISGEEMLITLGQESYFVSSITADGGPSRDYCIKWSRNLIQSVCYVFPFVLGSFIADGQCKVEVRLVSDSQSYGQFSVGKSSDISKLIYQKGSLSALVFSNSSVQELVAQDTITRVDTLIKDRDKYTEAISMLQVILSISADDSLAQSLLLETQIKHANYLRIVNSHKEALDLLSNLGCHIYDVISVFYPQLLSADFAAAISRLFLRDASQQKLQLLMQNIVKEEDFQVEAEVDWQEVILYLTQQRSSLLKSIGKSDDSLLKTRSQLSLVPVDSSLSQQVSSNAQHWKQKQQQNDVSFLTREQDGLIRKAKASILTQNTPGQQVMAQKTDVLEQALISLMFCETILLHSYLKAGQSTLASALIRVSNKLNVAEAERLLKGYSLLQDLVELYFQYNQNQKAVDYLADIKEYEMLSTYLFRINDIDDEVYFSGFKTLLNVDSIDVRPCLFNALCGPFDYKSVDFTLISKANDGVQIPEMSTRIIKFLNENDLALSAQYYLYLFFEIGVSAPQAHDQFILMLLDIVQKCLVFKIVSFDQLQQYPELVRFVEVFQSIKSLEKIRVDCDSVVAYLRRVLQLFMRHSSAYRPEKLINSFPQSFYDERAILLSRVGKHKAALDIYINYLKDCSLAETYCHSVNMQYPQVYHDLFDIYIDNLNSQDIQNKDWLLRLLHKYASELNSLLVYSKLPQELKLSDLQSYVRQAEILNQRRVHDLLIKKNVSSSVIVLAKEVRNYYKQNKILLTDTTTCSYCKRRFGCPNVFNVLSFGRDLLSEDNLLDITAGSLSDQPIIMHYSCYEQFQQYNVNKQQNRQL